MTNFVRIFILSCTLGFCSSYSLAQSAITQVSPELAMINEISPQDFNQLVQQNRFKSVRLQRPDQDRGAGGSGGAYPGGVGGWSHVVFALVLLLVVPPPGVGFGSLYFF